MLRNQKGLSCMTSHVVQITQTNAFECVYCEWLSRGASLVCLLGSVFQWAEISLEHWMCFDRLSLPAQTKAPILRLWIFPSLIIVVKLSAVHSVCNWTGAVDYYLPSWNANTVLQEAGAADIDPFTYCLIGFNGWLFSVMWSVDSHFNAAVRCRSLYRAKARGKNMLNSCKNPNYSMAILGIGFGRGVRSECLVRIELLLANI